MLTEFNQNPTLLNPYRNIQVGFRLSGQIYFAGSNEQTKELVMFQLFFLCHVLLSQLAQSIDLACPRELVSHPVLNSSTKHQIKQNNKCSTFMKISVHLTICPKFANNNKIEEKVFAIQFLDVRDRSMLTVRSATAAPYRGLFCNFLLNHFAIAETHARFKPSIEGGKKLSSWHVIFGRYWTSIPAAVHNCASSLNSQSPPSISRRRPEITSQPYDSAPDFFKVGPTRSNRNEPISWNLISFKSHLAQTKNPLRNY